MGFWKDLWLDCSGGYKGPASMAKMNLVKSKEMKIEKLNENINGLEGKSIKHYSGFQKRILGSLKYLFVYPMAKLGEKVGGKYLFDKAPEGCAFRNFQAWDNATEKALVAWYDLYLQDVTWKHPVKRLKVWLMQKNYVTLKLLHRIEMTLLLSDSAYFEYKNIQLLELYKALAELHGEQPVHILYKNKSIINDPVYFAAVNEGNYAALKQRIKTLETFYDAKGNLKIKYLGGTKTYVISQLANELNCVPKYDVMINQIRLLKQELFVKEQMLIHINKTTVEGLKPRTNEPSKASN